jgi:hypothetical protein
MGAGRFGDPGGSASVAVSDHRCDWRVDPNQVVISIGDEMRVRVVCAICENTANVTTRPGPTPDPKRVATWRAFQFKRGDEIVSV